MAVIHIHTGGGCEAIVREVGNELSDEEIHRWMCPNEPCCNIDLGTVWKKACEEHLEKWGEWSARKKDNVNWLIPQ